MKNRDTLKKIPYTTIDNISLPLADFLIIVSGDDARPSVNKLADPLKYVLGTLDVGKIFNELIIDGEVRRKNKKVPDILCQIEVSDERTHEPRLSYPCCKGKTQ
jgi:hypothetical protein